jgi:hypothetical protein
MSIMLVTDQKAEEVLAVHPCVLRDIQVDVVDAGDRNNSVLQSRRSAYQSVVIKPQDLLAVVMESRRLITTAEAFAAFRPNQRVMPEVMLKELVEHLVTARMPEIAPRVQQQAFLAA